MTFLQIQIREMTETAYDSIISTRRSLAYPRFRFHLCSHWVGPITLDTIKEFLKSKKVKLHEKTKQIEETSMSMISLLVAAQ